MSQQDSSMSLMPYLILVGALFFAFGVILLVWYVGYRERKEIAKRLEECRSMNSIPKSKSLSSDSSYHGARSTKNSTKIKSLEFPFLSKVDL